MTDKLKELALFASDRPTSLNDDLYQWAVDAEEAILAMISDLENERRKVTELVDGYEKDQAELKRLRATIFTDNTQTVVNAEKRIAELEEELASAESEAVQWKNDWTAEGNKVDALEADVERLTLEKKAAAMNYEAVIEGLKESATLWNKRYQDACQDRIALRQKYGHEIEALEAEVERLKAREPVAYQYLVDGPYGETWVNYHEGQKVKQYRPLYLASGAASPAQPEQAREPDFYMTQEAASDIKKQQSGLPVTASGSKKPTARKVVPVFIGDYLASGAAPKTLSDFVHSSDSEREKIGNVVAAKVDEAMDKLVKLSEELGLYNGAAQKESAGYTDIVSDGGLDPRNAAPTQQPTGETK